MTPSIAEAATPSESPTTDAGIAQLLGVRNDACLARMSFARRGDVRLSSYDPRDFARALVAARWLRATYPPDPQPNGARPYHGALATAPGTRRASRRMEVTPQKADLLLFITRATSRLHRSLTRWSTHSRSGGLVLGIDPRRVEL